MGLLGFFKGKDGEGNGMPEGAPPPPPQEGEAEPVTQNQGRANQFNQQAEDILSQLAQINSIVEDDNMSGSAGLSDLVESPEAAAPSEEPAASPAPPPAAPGAVSGDSIQVNAAQLISSLPAEYLLAPADELISSYSGDPSFQFTFNRTDVMMGLSQGKLEFSLGELMSKISLSIFSPEINNALGDKVEIPLGQVVSLVPPEWFRVQKQDTSKEQIVEEMDDLFDFGEGAPAPEPEEEPEPAAAEQSAVTEPVEEPAVQEEPVEEPAVQEEPVAPAEEPVAAPVAEEPQAAEEAMARTPYKSRDLVEVKGEEVLLDPVVALGLVPDNYLLLPKGEILDQVGGELTFSLNKADIVDGMQKGKLQFALKDFFLRFSFELFKPEGSSSEEPIELPLQQIVPHVPKEWYAVQAQDETPSAVLGGMDDLFGKEGVGEPESRTMEPAAEAVSESQTMEPAAEAVSESQTMEPAAEAVSESQTMEPAVSESETLEPAAEAVSESQTMVPPESPEAVPVFEEASASQMLNLSEEATTQGVADAIDKLDIDEFLADDTATGDAVTTEAPAVGQAEAAAEEPAAAVVEEPPAPAEPAVEEPAVEEESVAPAEPVAPIVAGIPVDEAESKPSAAKEDVEVAETYKLPRGVEGMEEPKISVPPPEGQLKAEINTETETFPVTSPHLVEQVTADEVRAIGEEVFTTDELPIGKQPVADDIIVETPDLEWRSLAPNGININRSAVEQLCKLPSVGPHLAQQIIDYRHKNGPFNSLHELRNVTGLGSKTFKEMTGISSRADLKTAELRLNRTLGLADDTFSLSQVANAALKKFDLAACFTGTTEGLVLVQAAEDTKMATFAEPMTAVAPQLYKRAKKALSQASLPPSDMFTFFLGKHAVTFAGADQVFCAMVHRDQVPKQRMLKNCRKFVNELVWYCSYRAVV